MLLQKTQALIIYVSIVNTINDFQLHQEDARQCQWNEQLVAQYGGAVCQGAPGTAKAKVSIETKQFSKEQRGNTVCSEKLILYFLSLLCRFSAL